MSELKYALVTGASRGIGKGISVKLASAGYNLIVCCEKEKYLLEQTAEEIREKYKVQVHSLVGDISTESFVSKLYSFASDKFPHIDVLVNNAGIWAGGLITETDPKVFKRLMDVNVFSMFLTVKAFAPDMINRKDGNIINITSVWGQVGSACEVVYSTTKGAIISYTKALAKELGPSGIRVNAIAPGVIDTDMISALGLSNEEERALKEQILLARYGKPEEIGQVVLSIIDSKYMTGQIITVDGGFI